MASYTLSDMTAVLKYLFPKGYHEAALKDRVLLGLMKKSNWAVPFGGRGMYVPVKTGLGSGGSHTFASAQDYTGPSTGEAFLVTRAKDYVIKRIDGETIANMLSDQASLQEGTKIMSEDAFDLANDRLNREMFGSGSNLLGIISSGYNTQTITLTNKNDIFNFHVNMEVCVSATEVGALRTGGAGHVTITAINCEDGTLTTDATAWNDGTNGIGSLVNGDYIFAHGDGADGSGTVSGLHGLAAWIPSAATGTHFSVTLTKDQRYAGWRKNLSGYASAKEICLRALSYAKQCKAKVDTIIVPYEFFQRLILEMDAKETITRPAQVQGGVASFGYEGVKVIGPNGPVAIFSDNACQSTIMWLLKMDTWEFRSAGGDAPRIISEGGKLLDVYNADTVEMRLGWYGQMVCTAPDQNVRVTIPSFS